jgi:hypothetical protein
MYLWSLHQARFVGDEGIRRTEDVPSSPCPARSWILSSPRPVTAVPHVNDDTHVIVPSLPVCWTGSLTTADGTVVPCTRLIHVGLVLRCRRDQPVFLLGIQGVHLPDTRLLC